MQPQKFQTKSQLKRFKRHFILGVVVIVLIILILAYSVNPKEEPIATKPVAAETFSAVQPSSATPAEVMTQHLTQFETNQQKINQQNAVRIAELESQNQAYQRAAIDAESNAAKINEKLATLNQVKANSSVPAKVSLKSQKIVIEDDINEQRTVVPQFESAPEFKAVDSDKAKAAAEKLVTTYIPANTFVKGILVGSLSANTGGNANTDPTPVLIRLTDLAQLPNLFRSNLRSCMVGGSGFGDLSTERVKIRLTNLSCVLNSGQAIDIPVEGYLDGEDAKAGIRGMVVTHSGTIAAKAALAGFLQGIGQVGQAMGQTQTITPLGGVTTTVAPDQALYAGGGAGVSQVGMTLSQYYLNMMKDISPAIEVSAGRHITVIFTHGVELKLPINQELNLNDQQLPL